VDVETISALSPIGSKSSWIATDLERDEFGRLRVRYELSSRAAWIGDAGLRCERCCWAEVGRTGGKAESAGPAARVNGGGRPSGPLGLGWATREWGRQNRLAGPGLASS
jgi:hypothetical protein